MKNENISIEKELPINNSIVGIINTKDKWESVGRYDVMENKWYDISDDSECEVFPTHWKVIYKTGMFVNTLNIEELELIAIRIAYAENAGITDKEVAMIVGINHRTLYRKKLKLGLTRNGYTN